jgi:hypothetical protein
MNEKGGVWGESGRVKGKRNEGEFLVKKVELRRE